MTLVKQEVLSGIEVTPDGRFFRDGKERKPTYTYTAIGNRATVRICFMTNSVNHYYQAAKLVAKAYLPDYYDGCRIIYKDGNIHNIKADNLLIVSEERYWKYVMRNSGHKAADIKQQKEKLRRIIKESELTLNYLITKDFSDINKYVEQHLLPILKDYCMRTLVIGRAKSEHIIAEALFCLYDCIWSGNAVCNYERWLKKILLNYKKKGAFGYMATGFTRREWEAESQNIDTSILQTKYHVKQLIK